MTERPARRFLAFRDAAAHIGRNEAYLRRLVADRRIRHYRLDGRLLFDVADLDAFLDAHVVETTAPSGAQW